MRILLIEDDEQLGSGLCDALKHFDNTVDWVKDGEKGELALKHKSANFDIVILDVGLPKKSGFEVLKNIRAAGIATPVIILTAHDETPKRVKGLDLGADDYLTKPFDLDELCARLRALQRRYSAESRAVSLIEYKNITLDPISYSVTINNEPIFLPRREFVLLQTFLENIGRVLSRDFLTQALYGWGYDIDSNALEVHIHNLRKKFSADLIKTIRGIGYIIEKDNHEKID